MAKETKETNVLVAYIIKNIVVVGSLAVAIINLWSLSKLQPIIQNIEIIKTRVEAIEIQLSQKVDEKEFKLVTDRIDRVQISLDKLIQMHIK